MTAGPYLAFVIPGTMHHTTEKQAHSPMEFLRTILRKNSPVVRDRLIEVGLQAKLVHMRTVPKRPRSVCSP